MRNLLLKKCHSLPYRAFEKVNLSLFQPLSAGWRLNRHLVGFLLSPVEPAMLHHNNANQPLRYAGFSGHANVK